MIDTMTQKPLKVSREGASRPYMVFPYSQFEDIRRILDNHQIDYRLDEDVVSLDGGPETAMIWFGREVNESVVQRLLDGVN